MKRVLLFSLISFSSLSFGDENPLIGKWEQDMELTMASINQSGNPPEKVKKCYEKNVCGHLTIEYKENTYRVSQHSLINSVSEFRPYKIISSTANGATIEETDGNGQKQIINLVIQNNVSCHQLEIEGFKYNECFRKIGL